MNLGYLGVSTRGGVIQHLAAHGVRAHRDPGALGGRKRVFYHVIRDFSGLCQHVRAYGACVMRWEGGIAEEDHFFLSMKMRHDRCD